MRIFLPIAAAFALAACGSQEEVQSEPAQTETVAASNIDEAVPPPRREEFTAAWAEACPEAEPVGKALCKSKGIAEPGFTCDFGLGDDEYRRHTADLDPVEDTWALVDPQNACNVE